MLSIFLEIGGSIGSFFERQSVSCWITICSCNWKGWKRAFTSKASKHKVVRSNMSQWLNGLQSISLSQQKSYWKTYYRWSWLILQPNSGHKNFKWEIAIVWFRVIVIRYTNLCHSHTHKHSTDARLKNIQDWHHSIISRSALLPWLQSVSFYNHRQTIWVEKNKLKYTLNPDHFTLTEQTILLFH